MYIKVQMYPIIHNFCEPTFLQIAAEKNLAKLISMICIAIASHAHKLHALHAHTHTRNQFWLEYFHKSCDIGQIEDKLVGQPSKENTAITTI